MIRRLFAHAVLALVLVSTVLACAAAIANHRYSDVLVFPAVLAFAVAGWLLTMRVAANNVGPLLAMTALGLNFQQWGEITAWMWHHHIAGAATLASLSQASFVFDVGGLALLLPLHFPDGRLPSPHRWWRVVRAADVGYMLFASVNVVAAGTVELPDGVRFENPLAIRNQSLVHGLITACVPLLLIGIAGSLSAIVVRWRAAGPERRAQIKWVALVLAITPVVFVLHDSVTSVSDVALSLLLPLVPTCIAVAVLRYRLYEIDRIVSRTVTYLVVTGVLVGLYIGLVALTTTLLSFGSSLGVAASTLAAAALFQPLRRRVQAVVDRRFNRARYDANRTVEQFAVRLRDEVHPDTVQADLLTVVAGVMQPAQISMWLAG